MTLAPVPSMFPDKPNKRVTGDPDKTLFVGKLSKDTCEGLILFESKIIIMIKDSTSFGYYTHILHILRWSQKLSISISIYFCHRQ